MRGDFTVGPMHMTRLARITLTVTWRSPSSEIWHTTAGTGRTMDECVHDVAHNMKLRGAHPALTEQHIVDSINLMVHGEK